MTDITATQELAPEKKGSSKACRYFKKGFCGFGENCSFGHKKLITAANCRYYRKASCKFASKCWNKHIPPNGKVYPRPAPLNKFIVVGPTGEEPDKIEDSTAILDQETEIRRSFKRPWNQGQVSKNCHYYEKKGTCRYGDKCWYSHSERPADELLHEENPPLEPEIEPDPDYNKMCYDFIFAECEFGDECLYVHGNICPFCDLPFLHPFDEKQKSEHLKACETFLLQDMDIAFRFMNSKDKMCGICLELVWEKEKPLSKQIFGLQEECNHIYCYYCIRKWRAMNLKEKQPLHCPACRTNSDIIVPSAYWFESNDEKKQWVKDFKAFMAQKPCKFYRKGRCEREGSCQYSHSGLTPAYLMEVGEGNWDNSDSRNQSPSGEQEGSNNLGTESVAVHQDQQDAGWRDLPEKPLDLLEQESSDDTPPVDQTEVDLDSSNVVTGHQLEGSLGQVNVAHGDEQNVEGQIQQDLDICGDTPENQANRDLLLQSSENTSSETTAQQFDDNLEQADVADVDEKNDEENQVVEDANVSLDSS